MPGNSHPSEGGEEVDSVMALVSSTEGWKDDESGANTMMSV
jgi:hypothetical protein